MRTQEQDKTMRNPEELFEAARGSMPGSMMTVLREEILCYAAPRNTHDISICTLQKPARCEQKVVVNQFVSFCAENNQKCPYRKPGKIERLVWGE